VHRFVFDQFTLVTRSAHHAAPIGCLDQALFSTGIGSVRVRNAAA
jgi:hypothetical protein